MAGRVEGKIALVTGGAMGLGKADCELLASEGATVIVSDREIDQAHKVAESFGGDAMALDVTDETQWQEVYKAIEERHGGLDILVNNAGNVIFEKRRGMLGCQLPTPPRHSRHGNLLRLQIWNSLDERAA